MSFWIFNKKPRPRFRLIEGYVDIHNHFIPGIDDGAANAGATDALINRFCEAGGSRSISTPHILGEVWPNTHASIDNAYQTISPEARKVITQYAAEYMIVDHFNSLLEETDLLCIASKHVLIELSYFAPPDNLYDILFRLLLKGYQPVLAHPERYTYFRKNAGEFDKLKKSGCLFQLNLLSLTEHYGRNVNQTARYLLDMGMYDFCGTDAHRTEHLNFLARIELGKYREKIHILMENNIKLSIS